MNMFIILEFKVQIELKCNLSVQRLLQKLNHFDSFVVIKSAANVLFMLCEPNKKKRETKYKILSI